MDITPFGSRELFDLVPLKLELVSLLALQRAESAGSHPDECDAIHVWVACRTAKRATAHTALPKRLELADCDNPRREPD
jgi:hypothetical protein